MKKLILQVELDGNTENFELEKNRIIIGRDKTCDIILNHPSISRKHAAIIHKFNHVYLENISILGKVVLNDKEVEYAELDDDDTIELGKYKISFRTDRSNVYSRNTNIPANVFSTPDSGISQAEPQEDSTRLSRSLKEESLFSDDIGKLNEAIIEEKSQINKSKLTSESQLDDQFDELLESDPELDAFAQDEVSLEEKSFANEPVDVSLNEASEVNNSYDPNSNISLANDSSELVSADASTVVKHILAVPRLIITKGVEKGREIKIERGDSWSIGRSRKCDITINDPKLSKHHFTILKADKVYRLVAAKTKMGTQLNGVNISDATIQSYDKIQAGELELQFIFVDSKLNHVALPSLGRNFEETENSSQQQTQFLAPQTFKSNNEEDFSAKTNSSIEAKSSKNKIQAFFAKFKSKLKFKKRKKIRKKAKPLPKKVFIYIGTALLLLFLYGKQDDQKSTVKKNVAKKTTKKIKANKSASIFDSLSPEQKEKIQKLYNQAANAKNQKDWNTAFNSSKEIIDLIGDYKNSKEILKEAQNNLSEESLKSALANKDEDSNSEEEFNSFLNKGLAALDEESWEKAEDLCVKALNINPTNEEANQCFVDSQKKEGKAEVVASEEAKVPEVDPNEELKTDLKQKVSALKIQLDDASDKIHKGKFSQALPLLKQLDKKLSSFSNSFNQPGRFPSSVKDSFSSELKGMKGMVFKALETTQSQLESQFESQFADAQQLELNKQYPRANSIYNQILEVVPNYNKALNGQKTIYKKMIHVARSYYQEALIYESIGKLTLAIQGYEQTSKYLKDVKDPETRAYFRKANKKLEILKR